MKKNGRPKVVLVGPLPPTVGGITTFILNLVSSALADEFEFCIYNIARPPKKDVTDNYGYRAIVRGGFFRILYGVFLTLLRLCVFPFYLIWTKTDIVQVHASDYHVFWEAIAFASLARLFGRVTLLRIGGHFDHFHGTSARTVKRMIEYALQVPDCLIVQSNFTKSYVQKIARSRSILVLPNWSNQPVIASSRPVVDAPPTALFIAGTEATRKGWNEILAALQALDERGVRIRFILCALTAGLRARIGELGLTNIELAAGPMPHEELLKLMREVDIFLLPSRGEGFPNSLIEAMAAGMASVVTPVAGVPEIVADGGAITIPVCDSMALTDAITKLATDPKLRKRLGGEAQRTVAERYTAQAALPPLADCYRNLNSAKLRRRGTTTDGKIGVMISAPDLDPRINVSGISTVVLELWAELSDRVSFTHVKAGSEQNGSGIHKVVSGWVAAITSIVKLLTTEGKIFHSNTALNVRSILRDYVLILAAKFAHKTVLLHFHGGRFLVEPVGALLDCVLRHMFRLADIAIFLSETEREQFTKRYPQLSTKSTSIYNSIMLPRSSIDDCRLDLPLKVMFAGRLVASKGLLTFFTVARADYNFPIEFTVYGDGPLRALVEAETVTNSRLRYGGVYDRSDWVGALEGHHIMLLPSHYGEGMPMIILEAMALGMICIATNIASIPEILGEGERGIIVHPDATEIVKAVNNIYLDLDKYRHMQTVCRNFAESTFDVRRNSERFYKLYQDLVAQAANLHIRNPQSEIKPRA